LKQAKVVSTRDYLVVLTAFIIVQGGSNMTGTDLYVNKPHCATAVRT